MLKTIIPTNIFNTSSTKDKYDLNKLYDDYVFQKVYYPYYFDSREDKRNYGIVDTYGNVVYPIPSQLKSYRNNGGTSHSNIEFVTDALGELIRFYNELSTKNKVNRSSLYSNINPASSTTTFYDDYNQYLSEMYNLFETKFLTQETIKDIHGISGFVKQLTRYIKIVCASGVINRSAFIKSRFVDPSINGLRIGLEGEDPFINVREKSNTYVANPDFDFFVKNAAMFGFYVDKNMPWFIVADLESPIMKQYMRRYNILKTQDVFDKYYFKAYTADIESLKNIILILWNKHATYNRTVKRNSINNCRSLFQETINYNQLSIENFDNCFGKNWIIRFYLYTRILEEKLKISQAKFEAFYEEASKIANFFSEEKAVSYVNEKINELATLKNINHQTLTSPDVIVKVMSTQKTDSFYEDLIF